jgi:6-phosphofructokinase 1
MSNDPVGRRLRGGPVGGWRASQHYCRPRLDDVEAQVRIGVLTGGGDCPGLNAVIRAVVRKGVEVYGHEFVGFRDGWRGPLEGATMELGIQQTRGILPRGGTILGSSRTNVMKVENGVERVRENLEKAGVDALVAIGGEDTLGVATQLAAAGVTVVGVPKTIDNDLGATDYTFGFDTAVQIAVDAIDRLHTTAESHHRALIVEVMGRHAGWIALHSGLAGGANVILIPERPFDIDKVCEYVRRCSVTCSAAAPRRRTTACSRPASGSRPPTPSTRASAA